MGREVAGWTIDYGNGIATPVHVPHAWRQDVPVHWEGPAVYRTHVTVESEKTWLVFDGVSYHADVAIDGDLVCSHDGIWDAFSISLAPYSGRVVQIEVTVIKNGGATYPVAEVASGFLPYMYHTFGGIYRTVRLVESDLDPLTPVEGSASPVRVKNGHIFAYDKPHYVRGVLNFGWYPQYGHTSPSENTIRHEVKAAKEFGFNLIKFCMWVPPHRYLETLEQEGMFAWMELPLWQPNLSGEKLDGIVEEFRRIIGQYRHHPNVLLWTVGCEICDSVPEEIRGELYELIKRSTPGLVRDSANKDGQPQSGEPFADYHDIHLQCEPEFYLQALHNAVTVEAGGKPILLGDFSECDSHRDLPRLSEEGHYWSASEEALNHPGVRARMHLPEAVQKSRFVTPDEAHNHERLVASSKHKAALIRKISQELLRGFPQVGGYIVSSWRDTPISSSGLIDDWHQARFFKEEILAWNSESAMLLKWEKQNGFYRDPWNVFDGDQSWTVDVHTRRQLFGRLEWDLIEYAWRPDHRPRGRLESGSGEETVAEEMACTDVGTVRVSDLHAGSYLLRVNFGGAHNTWPIWVVPRSDWSSFGAWGKDDPTETFGDVLLSGKDHVLASRWNAQIEGRVRDGSNAVVILEADGTVEKPFWRECGYEFTNEPFWKSLEVGYHWERFFPVSTDRAIDPDWLRSLGDRCEILMNRIDLHTYEEHALMARVHIGDGTAILTTLRPQGGLGANPRGVSSNPAGARLLHQLMASFSAAV